MNFVSETENLEGHSLPLSPYILRFAINSMKLDQFFNRQRANRIWNISLIPRSSLNNAARTRLRSNASLIRSDIRFRFVRAFLYIRAVSSRQAPALALRVSS